MSHGLKAPDAVDRVVQTVLGTGEPPDYSALVAAARERYGPKTPFVKNLRSRVDHDLRDLRLLEALVILSLGCHEAAEREGIDPLQEARRLAEGLEFTGNAERAANLLEFVCETAPTDGVALRQWESVARRLGRLDEPVRHRLGLAQAAEQAGDRQEAIAQLRAVLLLDPKRVDAAAWISELSRGSGRPRLGTRVMRLALRAVVMGVVGTAAWFGYRYDTGVRARFAESRQIASRDIRSLEERIADLERLMRDFPVWSGMLAARAERVRLVTEVDTLRRERELALQAESALERDERMLRADMAFQQAQRLAQNRVLDEAAAAYRRALELAPDDWADRDRARNDLAAIEAHLEQATAVSGK